MSIPENGKREESWFEFGDRLVNIALGISGEVQLPSTEHGAGDPKVLALTILARTISNFKGAAVLAQQGLVVEARILTRCCYENLLWIGGLATEGDAFVKAMLDDECKHTIGRGELIIGHYRIDDEVEKRLRARLRAINRRAAKPKSLNPKTVANDGPLHHAYVIYSQLSADSGHPSLTALARYICQTKENGEEVRVFLPIPAPQHGEIATTMDWACNALLGVCVGVNQIVGGTPTGQGLLAIADDYATLARKK